MTLLADGKASSGSWAGIYARVIAAGSARDDANQPTGMLRVTMLLTPDPGQGGVVPEADLNAWPNTVLQRLRETGWEVPLRVLRAPEPLEENNCWVHGAPDFENATRVTGTATLLRQAYGDDQGVRALAMADLWAKTFEWDNSDVNDRWATLSSVLASSFAGESISAGTNVGGTQPNAAGPQSAVKERGGISSQKREVEAVLPVQHGQLALALDFLRAREVLGTLAGTRRHDGQKGTTFNEKETPIDPDPATVQKLLEDIREKRRKDLLNAHPGKFYSEVMEALENGWCDVPLPVPSVGSAPLALGKLDENGLAAASGLAVDSYLYGSQLEQRIDEKDRAKHRERQGDGPQTVLKGAPGSIEVENQELNRLGKANELLVDEISRRFFALQGTPSLSRLFCLAIDLDVDPEAFRLLAQGDAGNGIMFLLGTDFGDAAAFMRPRTWTLAKLKREEGTRSAHFWPASRTEQYVLKTGKAGSPEFYTQYDGVMVLGGGWAPGDLASHNPRFDLTSLDVRAATETHYQRLVDRQLSAGQDPNSTDRATRTEDRQTLTTAGLMLLDRGRQHEALAKLANRVRQLASVANGNLVLDAEDLTTGYRLDVGVLKDSTYRWRSMMQRVVDFGANGEDGGTVRDLLAILAGDLGSERRRAMDAALLTSPIRFLPLASEGEKQSVDAIVEESVAVWDGGPMAVDCSGPDERKTTADDLPFGRSLSLPSTATRPPRLRFGVPYRFGLRAVFAGGGSLTTEEVSDVYAKGLDGKLAFPPASGIRAIGSPAERRRFLRHERVSAPFLLMPGDLAERSLGKMGYERTPSAIVRSYVEEAVIVPDPSTDFDQLAREFRDAKDRASPDHTARVFVAPSVAQAFATMHSVFDEIDDERPSDGLKGVRFDAAAGGFPSMIQTTAEGLNGDRFIVGRSVSASTADAGDLVFDTRPEQVRRRPTRYYPDPAAKYFVLALRHADGRGYLPGQSLVLDIYPAGTSYPDALPLYVSVETTSRRDKTVPLHEQPILHKSGVVNRQAGKNGNLVKMIEVVAGLAPGDDFHLDVWCAPSEEALARIFAAVESIAAIGTCTAEQKGNENNVTACIAAIGDLLPNANLKAEMDKLVGSNPTRSGYSGPGGIPLPPYGALKMIANALAKRMETEPIDEIAAVRTLRMTHAVNRPLNRPRFIKGTNEKPALVAARLLPQAIDDMVTKKIGDRHVFVYPDGNPTITPGAADFVLGGPIDIDLDTSDGFEIVARTISPTSPLFDDPQRGRSARQVREGTWPIDVGSSERGEERKPMNMEDVYGFRVAYGGKVSFTPQTVTLIRAEGIKSPRAFADVAVPDSDYDRINLEWLYGREKGVPGAQWASHPHLEEMRFSRLHTFPDQKARELSLEIVSLSRFSGMMRTADRKDGNWFAKGEDLPASQQSSRTDTSLTVWLQASARPSKPDSRIPVPVFMWTREDPVPTRPSFVVTRTNVVRIPLKRPWFSSGEDERLGIVIWPPTLFTQKLSKLRDDKVYVEPTETDPGRYMNIPDFEDEHLGPGGAFVTRWGADPIRGGLDQVGHFMPPSAFADYFEDNGVAANVHLEENVRIPIEVDGTTGAIVEGFNASLLTYAPRFDPMDEEWFVDVKIRPEFSTDPFVRLGLVRFQKHAPPDLQVSQPVVEWTQLLAARTVDVAVDGVAFDRVRVTVRGLSADQARERPDQPDDDEAKYRYQIPVVRVRLVHEAVTATGASVRHTLDQISVDGELPDPQIVDKLIKREKAQNTISIEGAETVWRASFDRVVPAKAKDKQSAGFGAMLDELGPGKLFVYVEEVEFRRPATYPHEPQTQETLAAEDRFVESGPRFLARIDIGESAAAQSSRVENEE